jgi:hypothetical protein
MHGHEKQEYCEYISDLYRRILCVNGHRLIMQFEFFFLLFCLIFFFCLFFFFNVFNIINIYK